MCWLRKFVATTHRWAADCPVTVYCLYTVWRRILPSMMSDRSLICRLSCDRWQFCAVYRGVESEYDIDWNWFWRYFQVVFCVSLSLIISSGHWLQFVFELFCLGNNLRDDGAKYIADVLKVNTTLRSFLLYRKAFYVFCVFFSENRFCWIICFHC